MRSVAAAAVFAGVAAAGNYYGNTDSYETSTTCTDEPTYTKHPVYYPTTTDSYYYPTETSSEYPTYYSTYSYTYYSESSTTTEYYQPTYTASASYTDSYSCPAMETTTVYVTVPGAYPTGTVTGAYPTGTATGAYDTYVSSYTAGPYTTASTSYYPGGATSTGAYSPVYPSQTPVAPYNAAGKAQAGVLAAAAGAIAAFFL